MPVPALYVQFSDTLDEAANVAVHALARRLAATQPEGVRELYPGYGNVYVEWDPDLLERSAIERWIADGLASPNDEAPAGRDVDLPVRYDGEDLEDVATRVGLSVDEVIARHSGRTYRTFAVGATPGMPFLGPLDRALQLPRRPTPRLLVPAHAVAITALQTTVYPVASPGGWNLLGTALRHVYDPGRAEPFLIASGDRVRFLATNGPDPAALEPLALLPVAPRLPALRVEEAGLLDLLVDAGRFGQAQRGMSQSGPLDRGAATLANALVGNPPGAPLLELTLTGPTLTALRPLVVGVAGAGIALEVDGEPVGLATTAVPAGAQLALRGTGLGARGYLAVAGGFEASAFLGSVSVDLRGAVGRPLAVGDVLGVAEEIAPNRHLHARPASRASRPLRLLRGPQYTPEAAAALASGTFEAAAGDRMGVRLKGPDVPGGELLSECPTLGAVQVTTGGDPIILLADRLRIGGYAKPAIVHPHDLGRVAQLLPGEAVRFAFVEEDEPGAWYLDVP